jgi:hypothetical protein
MFGACVDCLQAAVAFKNTVLSLGGVNEHEVSCCAVLWYTAAGYVYCPAKPVHLVQQCYKCLLITQCVTCSCRSMLI